MRTAATLLLALGVGFAFGRLLPGGQERPAPDQPSRVASEAENRTGRALEDLEPRTLPSERRWLAVVPDDPWIAHVLLDPEHHASDAPRITQAVLERPETIEALHACTPLFPATETKVRLRTQISISSTQIDIGPVESVRVVDEIDLSDDARVCLLSAFNSGATIKPSFPSSAHPYRGPFDFSISVVGEDHE